MARKDLDEEVLDEIADLANSTKQLARELEITAIRIQTGIRSPDTERWKDDYGDMQKLIVSIIRGSEIMFEELTGVKYS